MKNLISTLRDKAFSLNPSWYNRKICSTEGLWDSYFEEAEADMGHQWEQLIWPKIQAFDFDATLELAPGAGRNTEKLAQRSRVLHAVDLNEYALKRLRTRFAHYTGRCKLHFHKNQGTNLEMMEDESISTVYCWDAAVHFDRSVIRGYVAEFARVLKVGGKGFIHHANLGDAAKVDITQNPHFRSNMSKELFRCYCNENQLRIIEQSDISWGEIQDTISLFQKL